MKSPAYTIEVKELPGSEIEITGEIAFEELSKFREKALKNINNEVSIDGFRKGNIPEKVLVSKVGEMTILEEMAELAMSVAYPAMIVERKLDVIGRPVVKITKMAPGNTLEFTITSAVMPKFDVPDYKAIAKAVMAKKDEDAVATDEDVDKVIDQVRRSRVDHSTHDHTGDEKAHEEAIQKALPEFNDEFVKSLGDFENVEDFKKKIKESIVEEKKHKAKEKKRIAVAEKIIEETKMEIPEVIVESELNKLQGQFENDIARMGGIKLEDYLSHIKKTVEDLRKEWKSDAEKKAKFQLILNKIAEEEKIIAPREEVEKEVSHIVAHHKDADHESVRVYAESILRNEKIFQLFEAQK
jgi:FKBP-type peptidyl-prolyl cis-trans isomerase (trigger factor)